MEIFLLHIPKEIKVNLFFNNFFAKFKSYFSVLDAILNLLNLNLEINSKAFRLLLKTLNQFHYICSLFVKTLFFFDLKINFILLILHPSC